PQNTTLVNLLKTLGSGTLRFGGNDVEFTVWTPSSAALAGTQLGQAHLTRMFAFSGKVGWRVILGLNLGENNPARAADEASAAIQQGGSQLFALEIGNEPDQ